jgi:hypothetical protein
MHEFLAKDGNIYHIELDDGEDIFVYDGDGGRVGSITMMHVNADDYKLPSYYYIQNLDLHGCKRLGIGTEILRLHNKTFGEPITAANQFGPSMDDGSHLIHDGILFIEKMREEGLVCPEDGDDEDISY